MPEQNTARFQHPRKFANHPRIIRRIDKESKGCEEIHDSIESPAPFRRKLPHVTASISKSWPSASFLRDADQLLGIVEPVDIVTCFGEEMRMPTLAAWDVENA